jgi:hypothetical protein
LFFFFYIVFDWCVGIGRSVVGVSGWLALLDNPAGRHNELTVLAEAALESAQVCIKAPHVVRGLAPAAGDNGAARRSTRRQTAKALRVALKKSKRGFIHF